MNNSFGQNTYFTKGGSWGSCFKSCVVR